MSESTLLTVREAAALLRLHPKRVQILARQKKLPAVRVGRKWLFPRSRLSETLLGEPATGPTLKVEISARNQLSGKVVSVVADGVMAEVTVAVGSQRIVAVVTRSSVERLGIRKGTQVVALIKSTEVMLGRK